MKLLDLFCGRFGWSREFARRGWECVGVDLVEPPEIPEGCTFIQADIMTLHFYQTGGFVLGGKHGFCEPLGHFDFICASSPCEQFSVHGMKHFHPNPPYPTLGIQLFNHTRALCEASGVPYIMENVRAAQAFVGNAVHHCGPFYLWGTGVPTIMPQGITKKAGGFRALPGNERIKALRAGIDLKVHRNSYQHAKERQAIGAAPGESYAVPDARKIATALAATIPPELSACVADYAERILEVVA